MGPWLWASEGGCWQHSPPNTPAFHLARRSLGIIFGPLRWLHLATHSCETCSYNDSEDGIEFGWVPSTVEIHKATGQVFHWMQLWVRSQGHWTMVSEQEAFKTEWALGGGNSLLLRKMLFYLGQDGLGLVPSQLKSAHWKQSPCCRSQHVHSPVPYWWRGKPPAKQGEGLPHISGRPLYWYAFTNMWTGSLRSLNGSHILGRQTHKGSCGHTRAHASSCMCTCRYTLSSSKPGFDDSLFNQEVWKLNMLLMVQKNSSSKKGKQKNPATIPKG